MPETPSLSTREGVYLFDDFELDVPAFELRRGGLAIAMEPQVFEVLAFLVENAGRVLTKDEILDHVWPERYVAEASLNVRVMAARKALGDSGSAQRYIKTIHGRGYRFVGMIARQEAAAPVVQPVVPPPSAAPTPGTSFVGRHTELARLNAILALPSCRLVTIAGPGGVGKTRIALELLQTQQASGAATVFVPLEHVEPQLVVAAVSCALGIQSGAEDEAARVVAFLAANPVTLVLDNVEHALAEAVPLIQGLLQSGGTSRAIVTSRAVLGLPQEWVFRIGGLALESADATHSESESLFLERAERAGAVFHSEEDIKAIRELCRLADGLPLALEIAASLVRYLPPAALRDLVGRDAASLPGTLAGAPERHQSLSALFSESVRRLRPSERSALGALAAFEGPFDAGAATAVAGLGLGQLLALVDSSLVHAHDGRFSLHPLLRQYLRALDPAHAAKHAESQARHYAAVAAMHAAPLQGHGQLQAVQAMECDASNIVAAWRWAAANGRVELLERLRQPLFTFLIFRGRFLEANELAEAALPAVDPGVHPETAAALLVHHCWILMRIGQSAGAIAALQRAHALTREAEISWLPGYGTDPRLALPAFRVGAGDYEGGFAAASRALALAEADRDEAGIAFACWLCAVCLFRQAEVVCADETCANPSLRPAPGEARIDEARAYLDRAVAILEPQGEIWLRAYVELERGLNVGVRGQRETSCAHYRTAYALRRQLGDPQGMASALMYLADTLIGLGLLDEAAACHEEMRGLLLRSSDATGVTELLRSSGLAAIAAGDFPRARSLLRDAIEQSRALGFANNVAGSLRALGDVFLAEGQTDLAGRVMHVVAGDPSTTPGARALARRSLRLLGLEVPPVAADPLAIAEIVDEAVRASASLSDWLSTSASLEPSIVRPAVTAGRS